MENIPIENEYKNLTNKNEWYDYEYKKSVLLCKKGYKIVGILNTMFKDYVLYNIHIQ